MRRFRASAWFLFAAVTMLLVALVLVDSTPAIERIASGNFAVNESAINNGGATRRSANFIVWTDSLGEGMIGVMRSPNFIAYTSFVPAAAHSAGVPVEVTSFRLE